jgi:hypothetical protein
MTPPEKSSYIEGLLDALAAEDSTPPAAISTDDPSLRRRAHAILSRLWPNMTATHLPELADCFASVLEVGAKAQAGGRVVVVDLFGRLLAAFEEERERRGFKSYRELAETAVAVHQANLRDRERDRETLN